MRQITVALSGLLFICTSVMWAHDGGADPGKTAAPGEDPAGCAESNCHVGANNPTRGSGVEVVFPNGLTYQPGVKQTWTVRVNGVQANGYGFQLSVRLGSNEQAPAGRLDIVNAEVQIVCQDNTVRLGSNGCPASTPVEFATHVRPKRSSNEFQLDWTPPAQASGPVRVYVAGNAANMNGQNTGDRIFLNNYTLGLPAPTLLSANPLLQVWSDQPKLSTGTWMYLRGENLSGTTGDWSNDFQGNKAPTALGGTQVKVNGKDAFIWYVSPTQINFQPPDDDATGQVEVEVITSGGSAKTTINKTKVSPALLTAEPFKIGGKQYVISLFNDGTYVGRTGLIPGLNFRPAKPGDTINLYAVGCGPTNPALAAGTVPDAHLPLASPYRVTFGQTEAQATAFLTAPYIGLCTFQVTVPNVSSGDVPLDITVDGVTTGQELVTTIQP